MQEDQDDFNPLLEDFQNDVRKNFTTYTEQKGSEIKCFYEQNPPSPQKKTFFIYKSSKSAYQIYNFDLMLYVL